MATGPGNSDIEVRVTSNTDDLGPGLASGERKLQQSVGNMQGQLGQLQKASQQTAGSLHDLWKSVLPSAGLGDAVGKMDAFKQTLAGVADQAGGVSSLGSAAVVATTAMVALAGAFIGMIGIGAGISAFKEANSEVKNLSMTLGISREEASALRTVLDDAGMSAEEYGGIVSRVTMRVRTNADRLRELGVETKNADGSTRDMQSIMMSMGEVLEQYTAGFDRNAVAQELMGRNAEGVGKILKLLKMDMAEATSFAHQYGLVMTEADQKANSKFKASVNDVMDALEGFGIAVGRMVMPLVNEMVDGFGKMLPSAFEGFVRAVAAVVTVLQYLKLGFIVISEISKAVVKALIADWEDLVAVFGLLMKGEFSAAWDRFKRIGVAAGAEVRNAMFKIADATIATNKEVERLWSTLGKGTMSESDRKGPTKGKQYTPEAKDKAAGKEEVIDQFSVYQEQLKILKNSFDLFRDMEKKDEAQFWREKLSYAQNDMALYIKIWNAMQEALRADAQNTAKKEIKNFDDQIEAAKENKDRVVELSQAKLDFILFTFGKESEQYLAAQKAMTKAMREQEEERKKLKIIGLQTDQHAEQQRIAQARNTADFEKSMSVGPGAGVDRMQRIRQLNQQEYELKREALAQQADLEKENALNHAKVLADIARLDAEHNTQVLQDQQALVLETASMWQSVLEPISSAFSTSIQGMIMGTQTWQRAMHNILQSVLGEFISTAVKMLVRWTATELAKTTILEQMTTLRNMFAVEEAAVSQSTKAEAAVANVGASAAEAGAGAAASAASIPVYGWIIAGAAAAAIFALASGYAGGINSAAGGWWDIPSDQLAMVHQNEMVLPAVHAEKLRETLDGGGMGGGGGPLVGSIHVHAMDSQDVKRSLLSGGALHSALKELNRNFASPRG